MYVVDAADPDTGGIPELLHICRETGICDVQSFFLTECREHFYGKGIILCQQSVIFQIIRRIACGTQCAYIALDEQLTRGTLRTLQFRIGMVPYAGSVYDGAIWNIYR